MERQEPKDGIYFDWDAFNKVADEEGFGEHVDDWKPEWELWKKAFLAGAESEIRRVK